VVRVALFFHIPNPHVWALFSGARERRRACVGGLQDVSSDKFSRGSAARSSAAVSLAVFASVSTGLPVPLRRSPWPFLLPFRPEREGVLPVRLRRSPWPFLLPFRPEREECWNCDEPRPVVLTLRERCVNALPTPCRRVAGRLRYPAGKSVHATSRIQVSQQSFCFKGIAFHSAPRCPRHGESGASHVGQELPGRWR
jgi:hypothetical protein